MARLTQQRQPSGGRARALRRRHRQHRASLRQLDRAALERDGWRTMLEIRENHVRSAAGRLIEIETIWVAEAERPRAGIEQGSESDAGAVDVVRASARSESRAWARLVAETASAEAAVRPRRRSRQLEATSR